MEELCFVSFRFFLQNLFLQLLHFKERRKENFCFSLSKCFVFLKFFKFSVYIFKKKVEIPTPPPPFQTPTGEMHFNYFTVPCWGIVDSLICVLFLNFSLSFTLSLSIALSLPL